VVEPDHVGLDETLVRLEQRDGVVLDQVDVGQEQLGGQVLERLVHRLIDHRMPSARRWSRPARASFDRVAE
jgi:hypothetical protein